MQEQLGWSSRSGGISLTEQTLSGENGVSAKGELAMANADEMSDMVSRANCAGGTRVPSAASGKFKVEREIVDGEPVVRVTFGHRSCVWLFLAVWLTGWTLGCYKLLVELATRPFELSTTLMALPFLGAELVVLFFILMILFGRTVFTFRREGGTKFSGIGRCGITKKFTFPEKGEIGTDEIVRTGGKGGPRTFYRLVVKTQLDLDGPRVIYETTDADIVRFLCKAAQEVAGTVVPPETKKSPDELDAEAAESERRDFEQLAGKAPDGLVVSRDFEGRVFVVVRRVKWVMAFVLALIITVFCLIARSKLPELSVNVVAIFCVGIFVPSALLLFALFGKCKLTLDQGRGETFFGLGPFGSRRAFEYGGQFEVRVEESGLVVNGERMKELVVVKPDGTPQKICASWPNDVKPYLAALLRHPTSAPAAFS